MASKLFATARTLRIGLLGPALFMAALLAASGARAQSAPAPAPQPFTQAELQTLVGPIALYVDDLIGIVLPASAYPLQVVQAARFLDAREQNPSLTPDPYWDDSVVALLNYPEVLRMMDQNLDWTSHLGDAFVYQQADLLYAIQDFRVLAQSAGNLPSNSYQTVAENNGAITISPANPQVIYVPYYEPVRVVTYYSAPVIRYYPYGYPVYDYPYPAGYSFSSGFFWGVTTAFVLNWHNHYLNVYPYHYASHPYYGRRYYDSYYVRHYSPRRYDYRNDHDNVWRPNDRRGSHPYRYDDRRDRNTRTERQVSRPDHLGPSPALAIASNSTNSNRTQRNNSSREDHPRLPTIDSGNRSTTHGDSSRTPAADTARPSQASNARSVQRTPLKPPQTARTTLPARVAPTPSRPAAGNASPRVVRTPPARTVPMQTQTAALRPGAPAANRAPVVNSRASAPPTRASAPVAGRGPVASQRSPAQPPRAAIPAASNAPRQASPRPPKAMAAVAPSPARQPRKQEAARQGNGTKSEGRGKNQP
jgi:hypothetical protein